MNTNTYFIDILEQICINKDRINGKIKFNFIIQMLNKMDIIDFEDIQNYQNIVESEIIDNYFLNLNSTLFSRYNNEYEEYEKIGEGGFGNVFISKHFLDNKRYAIKKIIVPQDRIFINNTITEILILSRLNHDNIVRYYNSWIENYNYPVNILLDNQYSNFKLLNDDSSKLDNQYSNLKLLNDDSSNDLSILCSGDSCDEIKKNNFLIIYIQMELCEKLTLYDILKEDKTLDLLDKIKIIKQLIKATKYLHDNNIIHRDIKSKNILFSKKDMTLKLSDFGLSIYNNDYNHLTSSKGTYLYKDPHFKDKYMDIYSIGVIITELFCNFKTEMERVKILSDLKINKIPTNLPELVMELIDFCVCSDNKKRYNIDNLNNVINDFCFSGI